MRWMRAPVLAVFLGLCVAFGVLGGGTPSAEAYNRTGCKSLRLDRNQADHYRTTDGIGASYDRAVGEAARAWNERAVPGSLRRTSEGGQIVVRRASYSYDWYAVATWNCGSNGYYRGSRSITLNRRSMEPLSNWKRHFVIVHEFGHVMGLAHTQSRCGVSIMRPDAQTGNGRCWDRRPPWRDDVRGLNAIY